MASAPHTSRASRKDGLVRWQASDRGAAGRNLIGTDNGALYLGKVLYRPQSTLLDLAKSIHAGTRKEVTRMAASMLLHKRRAFELEQEVRLLWLDKDKPRAGFAIPIEPHAIEQVMTSPHDTWDEHRLIKAEVEKHGIECLRSGILRDPPTF
jgi:hypothetical protein